MIFIDIGLLRSLYCKISYLLAEEHWSHKNLGIWQPTYDSVCKDNSWIHGKCRQRFLSNVYKRFFYFLHVFLRFNVFYFHINVYYIYTCHVHVANESEQCEYSAVWSTRLCPARYYNVILLQSRRNSSSQESGLFQCTVLHKSAVLKKFVQFYSVKCAVGKWTMYL